MRICVCCKNELDDERFSASTRYKDGVNNQCKKCAKLRAKTKYKRYGYSAYNPKFGTWNPRFNWDQKIYLTSKLQNEKVLESLKVTIFADRKASWDFRRSQLNEEIETKKRKYPNYKKWKAQKDVELAFRRGDMVRPTTCSECEKECKPHAHHDDYNRPLNVRFLCNQCHVNWHKINGSGLI